MVLLNTRCQRSFDRDKPEPQKKGDSIAMLISKAKKNTVSNLLKTEYLQKAYTLNHSTIADTVRLRYFYEIASLATNAQDSSLFLKANYNAMQIATSVKDTFKMGDIHWNYGAYYLNKIAYDSAYYHYQKALDDFEKVHHTYYAAKIRYNMAFIQGRLKDYTRAEVLLFRAIDTFQELKKYRQLYECYNLLGIVYEELQEYDKAISYHQKALEYLEYVQNKSLFLQDSQNNIGLIYQKKGDQEKAISYFDKALEMPDLKNKDPYLYARLLDNRAHSQFLRDSTATVLPEFIKALYIRESLNNIPGVIMSNIRLAHYFTNKDTTKALEYANNAYRKAKQIKNNRDILQVLELLADLDTENKSDYLDQYIALNKKVQSQERKTRNKFMRIQYETNQYIKRNKELTFRQVWIIVVALLLILLISLTYWIYRQKAYNRVLQLESKEQKASEHIYLLSLKLQERLQQGRNQERVRISEELHDGILGRLFALRMSWGYLKFKGTDKTLDKHQIYLNELQQIEKDIRELSHELRNKTIELPIDFIQLVKALIAKRSKVGKFDYALYNDEQIPWEHIDNFIKTNLYRIVEEGLLNCIKHAQASMFKIEFSWNNNRLILFMEDNGVGFKKRKNKKGIGFKNMASRVKKMNGIFDLYSDATKGTIIQISIPITIDKK